MPKDELVTIDRSRYDELIEAEEILAALDAGGVDNWDWYDASLEDWRASRGIDE